MSPATIEPPYPPSQPGELNLVHHHGLHLNWIALARIFPTSPSGI